MRMKNEALKVLHSLGGRLEDDSLTESHAHEEQANAHSKTTKQSTSSKPQKAYRYSCSICKKDFTHIANHLRSGQHELKDEEIEEMRLKRKSTKLRENKSGKKKLRSCPIKSCNWEGYRLDYHLPHKHKVQKGSKKYNDLSSSFANK
ncbi:uncharacterized protein LOC110248157 [Exaiptasia diaphana]|uniref:Uncharacterized protein n=1 Tax=Exaiptasia diaphana TaxID=2652724 RepID=A0A913XU45_EXADI|nr:uncharacterized protein LOC110248157 [Exaiptasia diaphana]